MVDVTMMIGGAIAIVLFFLIIAAIKMKGDNSIAPAATVLPSDKKKEFEKITFGDTTVEAKILWTDRPAEDANKMCCFIFYGLLLAQFGVGMALIAMAEGKITLNSTCPEGQVVLYQNPHYHGLNQCVTQETHNQLSSMNCYGVNARRLSVGESVQHGRFLLTNEEDGMKATFQHDLFSSLAIMHESQRDKFNKFGEWWSTPTDSEDRKLQFGTEFGTVQQQSTKNLWEAMQENVEVPAVLCTVILVLVPLWLFVLKAFTAPVVWFTLLLDLAALVYYTIRMKFAIPIIVVDVIFVLIVFLCRKKILKAIDMLKLATDALGKNPSVFAACFVVFLAYVTYIAFWEMALISSTGVFTLVDCNLQQPGFVGAALKFMFVMFLPTTFFFFNCKLVVCATGLGAWFFHADDPLKPKAPAFVGLKWAFFDSAGPTFVASLVQYLVHEIRVAATNACWMTNPIGCALRLLWCCVEGMVRAFTKFMLLGHVFHGGAVIKTARNVYAVLHKHLGDAIVTDFISVEVVRWSTALFAVGMGFAGWAWMDSALYKSSEGQIKGFLLVITQGAVDGQSGATEYLIVGLCIILLYLSKYPITTLVVIVGLGQGVITSLPFGIGEAACGLLTGIFLTCITSIVFQFVGGVVHNSTDTMMYCVALELQSGKQQERFQETYESLKKHGVVQGVPADGDNVTTGKEVKEVGKPVMVNPVAADV